MDQCNLIVNYLPRYVDDASLWNMFAEHGEILQAKIARNKETGESLTYGFVKFNRAEDAASAISAKNGLEMGNKHLKVSLARRKPEDIQNRKLHVSKLPRTYSEDEYGDIIECRLLLEADRVTSRGIAFIEYNLASECDAALRAMHGVTLPGGWAAISVHYARPPPPALSPAIISPSISNSSDILEGPPESVASGLSPIPSGQWTYSVPSYPIHAIGISVPFPTSPRMAVPAVVSPTLSTPFFVDTGPPQAVTFPAGLREASAQLSGLPPFATIRLLYDVFSPYGPVLGAELNMSITRRPDGSFHDGTGWVRMLLSIHQIDEMNCALNNTSWFQGYPPVQITLTY